MSFFPKRLVDMSKFYKTEKISARIHPSEKQKLKRSGYNVRQAVEYFNRVVSTKIGALKIEEQFLLEEIEELEELLASKERRLSKIQVMINEHHVDALSSLRTDSYVKIIELYNRDMTNISFEDFIKGNYIQENFISVEVDKFPDVDMDTFCSDMLKYYNDVILVGQTF